MGKLSRRKGATGEREIVHLLREAGIPAKRISMMETNGVDKGDVEFSQGLRGQVKRGQHIPKFVYDALGDYDALFMRRDKQDWIVALPLTIYLTLFEYFHTGLKRVDEDVEIINLEHDMKGGDRRD